MELRLSSCLYPPLPAAQGGQVTGDG